MQWLKSKTETPNLIPGRADRTGSMLEMSFLWIRNTALIKALEIFRVWWKYCQMHYFAWYLPSYAQKRTVAQGYSLFNFAFSSSNDSYIFSGLSKWTSSFSRGNYTLAVPGQSWLPCDAVMPWFLHPPGTAPPWMHLAEVALDPYFIPDW